MELLCFFFFLQYTLYFEKETWGEKKIQNPRWQKYVSVHMEWFQINGFLSLHYVECYVMLCVRFLFTMFKSNCVSIHSANNSNLHRIFRYLFSATTTTWSSYETHNIFSSLTAGVLSFKWMLLFFPACRNDWTSNDHVSNSHGFMCESSDWISSQLNSVVTVILLNCEWCRLKLTDSIFQH